MAAARKRRRADGTLRPAYRRYRRRRRQKQREATLAAMTPEQRADHDRRRAERRVWLDNFKPGDRKRFFNHAVLTDAVFLRAFSESLGLTQQDAAPLLERVANERRWRKLRTRDGMVVGIAPDRRGETVQA